MHKGLQHFFRTTGAGRINDDDIGANTLPIQPRHNGGSIAHDKFSILYTVISRILLCIFNGGANDFDTDGSMCLLCEKKCDGARAAVGIDDRLLPL